MPMFSHASETGQEKIWNRDFICIFAANLLLNLGTNSVNSLVSSYVSFLSVGSAAAGVIVGLYFTAAFLFRPAAGPIQMLLERRRLLLIIFTLAGLSFVGYALSPSTAWFVAFRMLSGVAGCVVATLTLTAAAQTLPAEQLTAGLGYFAISSTLASALGPSLGIFIRDMALPFTGEQGAYRMVFAFAALLIFLALPLCGAIRPQQVSGGRGALRSWYRNVVDKRALFPALLILLVDMPCCLFTSYLIPFAAERGIGGISAFFVVYSVVLVGSRPVLNRLVGRFGMKRSVPVSLLVFLAALLGISASHQLWTILICAALAAVGYGMAQPCMQSLCICAVPRQRQAVASNTYYFGMDLGRAIAPTIFGGMIYPMAGTYGAIYLFACLPVLLAIVLILRAARSARWGPMLG